MSNMIDKFFDKVDEVVDATISTGKLGLASMPVVNADGKPVVTWHFGLYKRGLVCDPDIIVPNANYHEVVPRGGQFVFCRHCLVKAIDALRE